MIQVKSSSMNKIKRTWAIDIGENTFDNLFILCMDEVRKKIERLYIVQVLNDRLTFTITITENPLYGGWYEKYRIKDIRIYQEAYKDLLLYIGNKKSFGIRYIKEWLNIT